MLGQSLIIKPKERRWPLSSGCGTEVCGKDRASIPFSWAEQVTEPPGRLGGSIRFSSGFVRFQTSQNQSSLLLFSNLSAAHPTLSPKVCIFYVMPCTGYLCLLQNLVRMLWGLRFFPGELFSESKYYEEAILSLIITSRKQENFSQQTEQGEATYRNICKKSNIGFFFIAIKSCKHTNKCILIRVKLLVNEFALGFCIFSVKNI